MDTANEKVNFTALKAGDCGIIDAFEKGQSPMYRKKLLAMGLTPGTAFEVLRVAPLGDPLEISIRGYSISLRRAEAAGIIVVKS